LTLENNARQASGCEGSGINVDPVWSDVDFARWRVSMNDDFTEFLARRQKLLSYPKQVALLLTGEFDMRLHPGMDKEEIAAHERIL
jgi:hypothetical protein